MKKQKAKKSKVVALLEELVEYMPTEYGNVNSAALQGLLAAKHPGSPEELAKLACNYADALVRENTRRAERDE